MALVAEMERCDNIAAFAREREISTALLYTWRRELRYAVEAAKLPPRNEPRFVPVVSTAPLPDQVGAAAFHPLYRLIEAHVLTAERLHGNDTTVPVMAKGKTDTARLWFYVRDDRPSLVPPRQQRCSSNRATNPASTREHISHPGQDCCRPMPMAAMASPMLQGARMARCSRRVALPRAA